MEVDVCPAVWDCVLLGMARACRRGLRMELWRDPARGFVVLDLVEHGQSSDEPQLLQRSPVQLFEQLCHAGVSSQNVPLSSGLLQGASFGLSGRGPKR